MLLSTAVYSTQMRRKPFGHRRRSRGGGQTGQLPPLADNGANSTKCSPFCRFSEMMTASTEKHRHNRLKMCEILPIISVKFACIYFKNSSASGDSRPRTPVVWPHPKPPSAALAFGRPRFGPCGPQMCLGRPLLSTCCPSKTSCSHVSLSSGKLLKIFCCITSPKCTLISLISADLEVKHCIWITYFLLIWYFSLCICPPVSQTLALCRNGYISSNFVHHLGSKYNMPFFCPNGVTKFLR